MIPIVSSIINNLHVDLDEKTKRNFIISILIATAFTSTIGGTATIIGSPPNLILKSFFQETFEVDIHFWGWLYFGLPLSLIMAFATWIVLTKILFPSNHGLTISSEMIKDQIEGAYVNSHQKTIGIIFLMAILSWTLRPLYESYLPFEISDELIAIFFGLILFIIPTSLKQNKFLLDWNDTHRIPWGILLLFGSGIAISNAINELEIFNVIAAHVSDHSVTSKSIALGIIIIFTIFATETINNTSLAIVMIPLVAALCIATGLNPLAVSLMTVFLISSSFILAVATPSNSLIFINHHLTGYELMKAGSILKVLFVILTIGAYYFGLFDIYKIDFEIIKPGNAV